MFLSFFLVSLRGYMSVQQLRVLLATYRIKDAIRLVEEQLGTCTATQASWARISGAGLRIRPMPQQFCFVNRPSSLRMVKELAFLMLQYFSDAAALVVAKPEWNGKGLMPGDLNQSVTDFESQMRGD